VTLQRKAQHRRSRWAILASVVMVFSLMGGATVLASHPEVSLPGSNFEIDTDANLKVDDPAPSTDWAGVSETRKADTASGSGDESFGNGTKEDTAVPSVVDGGIPPNKSDLKFFGVYQEGTTASGFLNLFWSRVQEPSGTTNMDFEFNAKFCDPDAAVDLDCTANGLTPIRSEGDLLIQYDLSQGGVNPLLFVSEWVVTGNKSLCEAANSTPCWGDKVNLTTSGDATGSINTTAIPAGESDGLGAQSSRTFGEAQLDLSAIFDTNTCQSFGSAYLKSRSSDSFTAALKDFVPPVNVNVSNCGSIEITKTDDAANPLAGAVFTLYTDNAPQGGAAPHGAEDTATTKTCTTGTDGKCTIQNVLAGQYWVVETTTPDGYNTAADQHVTVTASTTPVPLTFMNPRLRGAIIIQKEAKHYDQSGETSPTLAGAGFTISGGPGEIETEVLTDANGVACLDGLLFGDYDISETTVPAGYAARADQEFTVGSSGSCPEDTSDVTADLTFTNDPLTDITVEVDSQIDGGTSSTISCENADEEVVGSGSTDAVGDGSVTVEDLTEGTYICTVVIDP
jgi:Prealbumin-like fold domain